MTNKFRMIDQLMMVCKPTNPYATHI